ncbi:hypothetical protein FALBO_4166 [Fusarium albosuccineum]|uniref:Uncharacterized protein n=1 Tax=Fusarium albosuccineum TaxID=1237068 RepID=A0A8H4LJD3_9HYPO|nr:hypothetical protein FALBO_4166 [Fusarium albosuccineum]
MVANFNKHILTVFYGEAENSSNLERHWEPTETRAGFLDFPFTANMAGPEGDRTVHHAISSYRLRRGSVESYLRGVFNDYGIEVESEASRAHKVQVVDTQFVFYLNRRLTSDEEQGIVDLRSG